MNLQCNGVQYKIGQPTRVEGELELCRHGIHFCLQLNDCFDYYDFNVTETRICEVEAIEVKDQTKNDSKRVCHQLTPIRELNWNEILTIINSGNMNTGRSNSGDRNSGYRNSGDSNSGDSNSGNRNSGDSNSGIRNSGDSNSGNNNSGDSNSGDRNSGISNSGDRNSGSWNSCNDETGIFNSVQSEYIRVFNQPCERQKWIDSVKPGFIYFNLTHWICFSNMTDEEKAAHSNAEQMNGYLKLLSYKDAWAESFKKASPYDIELLKALPNFDAKVFEEISGIHIE